VAWQVRTATLENKSDATAFSNVENGAIPTVALGQYQQWKCTFTPTNIATPIVADVTMRVYTGSTVNSPCAEMWKKAYWLCVQDTGSDTNNVVYWLDEEAVLYGNHERWSKLGGIEADNFFIFNDQIMSTSVGGTGKGGFIYYEDTGVKDLGVDFTARLVTQKDDMASQEPTFRFREKLYRRIHSKYQSQQDASLYYKINAGSWSSAITLSAKANLGVEKDYFSGLQRGIYHQYKWEQSVADPDLRIYGFDTYGKILRFR